MWRPPRGTSAGLTTAAVGSAWTIATATAAAPRPFTAFGVVLIVVGLVRAARSVGDARPTFGGPPINPVEACPRCARPLRGGAAFCPTCGQRQ